MRAIVINHDKQLAVKELPDLTAMQAVVGGLIEAVDLRFRGRGSDSEAATMWVNEEYLIHFGPTEFNSIASDVCGLGGRPDFMFRIPILGNAFLTGGTDVEGNTLDVGVRGERAVRRVAREAGGVWS